MFYKTEGERDKGIKVAISDKLTSGYIALEGNVDQTDQAVEGSSVFKLINSETYILMYDVYMDGRYQFTKSNDLENFKVVDQQVSMNFHPRHGTVIPITKFESERLLRAFPSDDLPTILGSNSQKVKINNIIIEEENSLIYLPVKSGIDLSNFDPDFKIFPGATIKPEGSQDFEKKILDYTIDVAGVSDKTYKVTAEIANNPVLNGYYADPEILYSNKTKRYYLYPTSDGFTGWSGTYFKSFSSDDLINWKDEGIILDLEKDVNWADKNAWAPCITEKEINGEYNLIVFFSYLLLHVQKQYSP